MNYFSFQIQLSVFFTFQDFFINSFKVHNYAMYAVGFIHFNKHDFLHFQEGIWPGGGGGRSMSGMFVFPIQKLSVKKIGAFSCCTFAPDNHQPLHFILIIYVI